MMILAVDVGSHHAPERDEARPRRDWCVPAARQEHSIQLIERESGFGMKQAVGGIEGENAIGESRTRNDSIGWGRQRGITIGPTEPARQRDVRGDLSQVLGADLLPVCYRHAAPPRQLHV